MQTVIITPDEAVSTAMQITQTEWHYLMQQTDFVELLSKVFPDAGKLRTDLAFQHVVGMILLGLDAVRIHGAEPSYVLPSLYQYPSRVDGVYKMIARIREMGSTHT